MKINHQAQLMALLKDQTQPINSIVIRKKLKEAGLYNQADSKLWTEALQKMVLTKQIIQVPITGQSLKHGYELNRAQTISTTEPTTKAEQPKAKKAKQSVNVIEKTITKPNDPLAGFLPLNGQSRGRMGLKINCNHRGAVLSIYKETAQKFGIKTGELIEIMTNPDQKEIALVKSKTGFKLSGTGTLYLKIGFGKSKQIKDLLQSEITLIKTLDIQPEFLKAKLA